MFFYCKKKTVCQVCCNTKLRKMTNYKSRIQNYYLVRKHKDTKTIRNQCCIIATEIHPNVMHKIKTTKPVLAPCEYYQM